MHDLLLWLENTSNGSMKILKSLLEAYLKIWGDLMRNWLRNLGFYHKTLTRNESKAWLCLDLEKAMDSSCFSCLGWLCEEEERKREFF